MNWYKKAKDMWYDTGKGYKIRKHHFDWSLECCGLSSNRRKDPYKSNKSKKE